MRDSGLAIKESYIFEGDFSKESGRRGAQHLLTVNPELTALFVASDLMAVGALSSCRPWAAVFLKIFQWWALTIRILPCTSARR